MQNDPYGASSTTAAADPYGDLVKPPSAPMRAALTLASDQSAADLAKARKTAGYIGAPVAAVQAAPKLAAEQELVKRVESETVDTPVLQRQFEDPAFAVLGREEVSLLAKAEKGLKSFFAGRKGPNPPTVEEQYRNTAQRFDLMTEQDRRDIKTGVVQPWKGPAPTFTNIVKSLAQTWPQQFEAVRSGASLQMGDVLESLGIINRSDAYKKGELLMVSRARNAQASTTPDFNGDWNAEAVYGGVQSTLRMLPALLTRSTAGILSYTGATVQQEEYGKFRERGGKPGESFVGATANAAIEVATELLPTRFMVDQFGKVGAGKFMAGFLGRDAWTEQVATHLQDAVDTAIANPNKTWGDYLAERPEASYKTLIATLVQTGLMGGANKALLTLSGQNEEVLARQAEHHKALDEIMQTAAGTKLRELDQDMYKTFVQAAADGTEGAPKSVFVDGATMLETLQQAGVTDQELDQLLPSVRAQLEDAAQMNAPVEIPIGELVSGLPGHALEQALKPHLRLTADGMSRDEAEQAQSQAQQFLEQQSERLIQQATDSAKLSQSAETVRQTMHDQLMATGRMSPDVAQKGALLVRDFYTVMAGLSGKTPDQLYAEMPYLVQASGKQTDVLNMPEDVQASEQLRGILSGHTLGELQKALANYRAVEKAGISTEERAEAATLVAPYLARAKAAKPEFDATVKAIADAVGVEARLPGLKKAGRTEEKLVTETRRNQGGTLAPQNLWDLLRATVVVATPADVAAAIEAVKQKFEVVRVKDRFATPTDAGYRDVLINVRLPDGLVAEVQINIPSMIKAKSSGHKLYAMTRSMEPGDERARLEDLQQRVYAEAFDDAQRAMSASSAGVPLANSDALGNDREGSSANTVDPSSSLSTGVPSTSYNLAPGGTENIADSLENAIVADAADRLKPLPGAPTPQGATGPDPALVAVAEKYALENGIDLQRQSEYVTVDEDRATRIAAAYTAMAHAPQDPKVAEAYAALIQQTRAQYDTLVAAGFTFTFFDSKTDPYDGNPMNAMRDIRANKTMAVYGTYDGFGSSAMDVSTNPLLAATGLQWPDQAGVLHDVLANDMFRAVHDAFGHGLEGAGFRARGEENAWQAHVRLFTGPAVGAITTETRGQNSWLNYGPHGEHNRNAKVEDTIFADQKTGLMPEWTWLEGVDVNNTQVEQRRMRQGVDLVLLSETAKPLEQGGEARVDITGYHFSKQPRTHLDGRYYGTGLKGIERERLANQDDRRLRERVYAYVDEGKGVRPEAGVGGAAHTVQMNNLYEISSDPLKLVVGGNLNQTETNILNAGFDGYYVRNAFNQQGAAVVIGEASRALAATPVANPTTKAPPLAFAPQSYRLGMTSREINLIDIEAVKATAPSASLRFGTFKVDMAELDAARASLSAQGVELPEMPLEQSTLNQSGRAEGDTRYTDIAVALAAGLKAPARSAVRFFTGEKVPYLSTNADIARFFTKKNGGLKDLNSGATANLLVDALYADTVQALTDKGSAVGWYDRQMKAALDNLAQIHPEILQDDQFKFGFIVMTAITSNSTDVYQNFKHAELLFRQWKTTGAWPRESVLPGAKAAEAITKSLVLMEQLVATHGWQYVAQFMQATKPVGEIASFSGLPIKEADHGSATYGAAFLGPKVGAFFNNLYGNFTSVTMDRWFMRSVNRVRGNMLRIPAVLPTNLAKLVAHLGEGADSFGFDVDAMRAEVEAYSAMPEADRQDATKAAKALPRTMAYANERTNKYQQGQNVEGKQRYFYPRSSENLTAKAVHEALNMDEQTPINGADRVFLRKVMVRVQDRLRENNIPIDMADLQAVLWYYEKDLFATMKGQRKQAAMFAEAEAEDYESAATRLVGELLGSGAGSPGSARPGKQPGAKREKFVETTGELFQRDNAWLDGTELRDEQGDLLTFYHGTRSDFPAFKRSAIESDDAFFFSTNPSVAGLYVGDDPEDGSNIIPVHLKGKKFYEIEELAWNMGEESTSPKQIRRMGYAGFIIRGQDGGDTYAVFKPEQIKSVFNKNPTNAKGLLDQGPRGTFDPSTLTTVLNDNANLSTFLHETGHFFHEALFRMAREPGAPAQIVAMAQKTLGAFGVKDMASWDGMAFEAKRKHYEHFAESFELYLFSGRAPNKNLADLFRTFKAWLTRVYKSIEAFSTSKGITLDKDLKDVMDRMVATEEQIAEAEEIAGLIPAFDPTQEAMEKLQARSLRDLKWAVNARNKVIKDMQKDAKAKRKEVEAEVTAEVDAMPVYAAMKSLSEGVSISIASLEGMYMGEGDRYALLDWKPLTDKRLARQEGAPADYLADSFGFDSGDALVRALLGAEPKKSVVEGMTDQRMLERYGDLTDADAIAQAATEAVHNESRAKSLATELAAQRDLLNPRADTGKTNAKGQKITVNALVEAAKQFAEGVIGRRKIAELKKASWNHLQAERRAAKAWEAATSKGDTAAAVVAKQDQMLNHAAVKSAQDAQAETRKIIEFFRKVVKGNDETVVDKGRDPDIVNAARAVLAAYGVAPATGKTAFDYLELLRKNDADTFAVLIEPVQAAVAAAKPFMDLTMAELRALNDEVAGMWHLAKASREYEVAGDMMDVADAAQELKDRMDTYGVPLTVPGDSSAVTEAEKRGRWLQFAGSLLRRVESWAEGMDGKFGGPFLRLVYQPVSDAANRYRTDRIAYRKAYVALLENVAPAMPVGAIDAPELGYVFGKGKGGNGRAEIVHALLHLGNNSNKRKLLLGRNWAFESGTELDTSKWDTFIARMHDTGVINKAHYDFAQGVWDLLEQTKPLAQKAHRDAFGRYFAEVTSNAFETPFGSYRGGYVPAQVDTDIVRDNESRKLAEMENENMAYSFPSTNKGFTKARTEYNRPLLLDLRSITQHLDKVLLFSHMTPAVRGVAKVLRDKGVAHALGRIDPSAVSGMLDPWLNRSARQIVETPIVGDGRISRVLSVARQRAGMSVMFANISNTIQQATGLSLAAVKVKPGYLAGAMAQYARGPKKVSEAVAGASAYMATRMENEVSALNGAMEDVLLNPSAYESAQQWTAKHAYFMQSALDNVISPVVWSAAYNQGLAEKMSEVDAVRFADGVVRQTQGSTQPEDISRIESGPAYARIFTQFLGYFNMMANTNATALKQIAKDVGLRKGAGKALPIVFFGLLAPAWIAEAIALAFKGGPDDEDKDGSYLNDWLSQVFGMGLLKTLFAGVPFAGQLAMAGVNTWNDKPYDDRTNMSPAISMLESTTGALFGRSLYKAIAEDGSKQKAVRDVATAVSIMTGLPFSAAARPVGYLAGVEDSRVVPAGDADMVRGLLTGTASPESKR